MGGVFCPPDSPLPMSSLISAVAKAAEATSSLQFLQCSPTAWRMHYMHLILARESQEVARKSSGSRKDFQHISTTNDMIPAQLWNQATGSNTTSTWKRCEVLKRNSGQDLHTKIKLVSVASTDIKSLHILCLEAALVSSANQNTH